MQMLGLDEQLGKIAVKPPEESPRTSATVLAA